MEKITPTYGHAIEAKSLSKSTQILGINPNIKLKICNMINSSIGPGKATFQKMKNNLCN